MRIVKPAMAALLAILLLMQVRAGSTHSARAAPAGLCHFGIAAPYSLAGYDLSLLGVGSYLDWRAQRSSSVEETITHLNVLNVSDAAYQYIPSSLPNLLAKDKGATWIIGNEPDSEVDYQDHISPERYGERYYELAAIIRARDPDARIAFGTIIQPTQIRITYLQKAIERMVQLAGGDRVKALGLIDIYSIHAFILNESPLYDASGHRISWGAGVPPGYNPSWGEPETIRIDAEVDETWKTHSIDLYKQRIIRFRQWMKALGEQNKPLWVTEYGSLFPPSGNEYLLVSDQDTALFMEQTFDFTLGYKDSSLGYAGDQYRLVQHLVWYSLNEKRTSFGGSLFDPLTKQRTLVGDRFVSYNPLAEIEPPGIVDIALVPRAPAVLPAGRGSLPGTHNFRIVVRAANLISSDRRVEVQLDLYEGERFVGRAQGFLPRCSGQGEFSIVDSNLVPGKKHNYRASIRLLPGSGSETNPGNQELDLPNATIPEVNLLFLATVRR